MARVLNYVKNRNWNASKDLNKSLYVVYALKSDNNRYNQILGIEHGSVGKILNKYTRLTDYHIEDLTVERVYLDSYIAIKSVKENKKIFEFLYSYNSSKFSTNTIAKQLSSVHDLKLHKDYKIFFVRELLNTKGTAKFI